MEASNEASFKASPGYFPFQDCTGGNQDMVDSDGGSRDGCDDAGTDAPSRKSKFSQMTELEADSM